MCSKLCLSKIRVGDTLIIWQKCNSLMASKETAPNGKTGIYPVISIRNNCPVVLSQYDYAPITVFPSYISRIIKKKNDE